MYTGTTAPAASPAASSAAHDLRRSRNRQQVAVERTVQCELRRLRRTDLQIALGGSDGFEYRVGAEVHRRVAGRGFPSVLDRAFVDHVGLDILQQRIELGDIGCWFADGQP